MSRLREVIHVVTAHRQREGGGFVVRRPFPGAVLDFVDPFLLLDEMGPADYAPGEALGVSAVIETRTPILYHDWTLEPGADVTTPVPDAFDAFAYVFEGEPLVSGHDVVDGQMALLGPGDGVRLTCASGRRGPARLLLVGGAPLREPVARLGPFVMNSDGEIRQALLDFQSGRMGRIGS